MLFVIYISTSRFIGRKIRNTGFEKDNKIPEHEMKKHKKNSVKKKQIPATVIDCPENPFISFGETTNTTHLFEKSSKI